MKKGFTIIELLATLTILLLVATILVPNLITMSDKIRSNQYESQIELILSAAREYGEDNINILSTSCYNITVQKLITDGYLKADSPDASGIEKTTIRDARDKDIILNNKEICLTYNIQATVSTSGASTGKNYYKVNACFNDLDVEKCS